VPSEDKEGSVRKKGYLTRYITTSFLSALSARSTIAFFLTNFREAIYKEYGLHPL
jgi:hypothetical protein